MLYNLNISLYTDGDYSLSDEMCSQAVTVGHEEYHFNWTLQADSVNRIKEMAKAKVEEIQNSVLIINTFSESTEEYTRTELSYLFNNFYKRLNVECNESLNYIVQSFSFGTWEGTCIELSPTKKIVSFN